MRLTGLAAFVAPAAGLSVDWYDCPLISTVGNTTSTMPKGLDVKAECADVTLPLCHPGVCSSDKTVSIFFKRLPATRPTTPAKSVWMLQGGPGIPSNTMESILASFYHAANGTTSFYTMDHRGVGRSTKLDTICADLGDDPNALPACFHKIKQLYGADAPAAFSVTSAAADMAAVIASPAQAKEDVYVYGVSYGTYLVERLMHFPPANVKGYILDSVVGESPIKAWDDWDRDTVTVESIYYAHCDKDPVCASKIGPDSRKFALNLYAKLDKNDTECAQAISAATGGAPSDFVGQTFLAMMQQYSQRNMVPAILYRLNKCVADYAGHKKFLHRFLGQPDADEDDEEDFGDDDGAIGLEAPKDVLDDQSNAMDQLLHYNVVFNELWNHPSPSVESLVDNGLKSTWRHHSTNVAKIKIATYCAFRGNKDPVCDDSKLYPKLNESFSYPVDKYWNKTAAVPSGASVLIMSGDLDVQTIPKYAVAEHAKMAGDNKLLLRFPFGGHAEIITTNDNATNPSQHCGASILTQYVGASGNLKALDTSCMARVVPLEFTQIRDATKAQALFGKTRDMYGDAQVRVQSAVAKVEAKYAMEVAVLACGMVACVLVVAAMAIYIKKQRRSGDKSADEAEKVVEDVAAAVEPTAEESKEVSKDSDMTAQV